MDERHIQDLIDAWFDGVLTGEGKADLEGVLLASPHARERFWTTARIHALLRADGEGRAGMRAMRTGCFAESSARAAGRPPEAAECAPAERAAPARPVVAAWPAALLKGWRVAAAAAAAVLLAGGVLWRGIPLVSGLRSPASGLQSQVAVFPVQVTRQWGASGLELPCALPGTMRLGNGLAVVRLQSGVELTLLGPLKAEIRDAMLVRLEEGRLLADVPPRANSFTVLTRDLEVWDLGTVFGVSVEAGRSDVFVFKGSAQVNEASGEPVDLCVEGEGVCVLPGTRPLKVAADWPEARKVFAAVRGTASLAEPAAAFNAVGRVTGMWFKRYAPSMVPPPPPPVPGLRETAAAAAPPGFGGRVQSVAKRSQTSASFRTPVRKENEMRGMTNTVAALTAAAVLGTAGTAYAVPEVTNVRMQQRTGTRVVDVWYDLAGEAAIVTLGIETNGVALPDNAVTCLSGDVSVVIQPGMDRHIVWNAGEDWPENRSEMAKARVTAWSVGAPPTYCAVDVTGGPATNSYPVYYYASAEGVPGGVTNELYKTLRILMRRIGPSGGQGFTMGSPVNETGRNSAREAQVQVVLTKAFYAGVYEVTQSQWYQVMGNTAQAWPSKWNNNDYKLTRPVEQVSYYDIRENINNTDDAAVDWPANDAVTAGSFMGRLRTRTGLAGFDLPTDAQWEYACRAGTTKALNDGTVNLTNTNSDACLDRLGRYQYNGGKVWDGATWVDPSTNSTAANATAVVGAYAPNAWGLYDMHGNVFEWCLDWYTDAIAANEDPRGAGSGTYRAMRGGSWLHASGYCRSAFRNYTTTNARYYYIGFRLFRTLP